MNFLPGRIGPGGGSIELPGGTVLPSIHPVGAPGQPVTLGIRPEHLALDAPRPASAALHVTAELVEALGADTLVHCRLGGSEATLLARLPGTASVKAGDDLTLAVPPEELHVFDPASGKALAS